MVLVTAYLDLCSDSHYHFTTKPKSEQITGVYPGPNFFAGRGFVGLLFCRTEAGLQKMDFAA